MTTDTKELPPPNEAIERLDETQVHSPGDITITVGDHELKGISFGEDLVISPVVHRYENGECVGELPQSLVDGDPPSGLNSETQGHAPGKDHDGAPPLTTEQVNALKAQVQMCQSYIVFVEKKLELFLGGTDKAMELDLRVQLAIVGWRIIQDENATMKGVDELRNEELRDWKQSADMMSEKFSKIIPGWQDWSNFERRMSVGFATQKFGRVRRCRIVSRLRLGIRSISRSREWVARSSSQNR